MDSLDVTHRLEHVFQPATRDVVSLVSDLLKACPEGGLELNWHAEICRVYLLSSQPQMIVEIPLPRFVIRTVIARVAALCNEHQANSVSPYGGHGALSWAGQLFEATFRNTPGEQQLTLIPIT